MTLCEKLTTELYKSQARPAHLVATAAENRLSSLLQTTLAA
jgi:hypothetical protein